MRRERDPSLGAPALIATIMMVVCPLLGWFFTGWDQPAGLWFLADLAFPFTVLLALGILIAGFIRTRGHIRTRRTYVAALVLFVLWSALWFFSASRCSVVVADSAFRERVNSSVGIAKLHAWATSFLAERGREVDERGQHFGVHRGDPGFTVLIPESIRSLRPARVDVRESEDDQQYLVIAWSGAFSTPHSLLVGSPSFVLADRNRISTRQWSDGVYSQWP